MYSYEPNKKQKPEQEPKPEPYNRHKIIIGFNKTKRTIDGPFHLCGNYKWLTELAYQILRQTKDSDAHSGWVRINIEMPDEHMINNVPVPWD